MKVEEFLVAAIMAAMALITAANVVTRYLSNVSLAFTEEYSVALMIGLALLGTGLAVGRGTHVRIPFFVEKLSPRGQRVAEAVAMALTILCFSLLALHGAKLAYDEWDFEFVSSGLGHPQYLYTMWLPILSLVVIARALLRMIRCLRGENPWSA